MGLSAWKQFGRSRWALRVNPSSGNLHPTECYLVARSLSEEGGEAGTRVHHYAADRHELELRARHTGDLLAAFGLCAADTLLVGLTSIHWREAWKYGERAFRYCQHDTGHAIAAVAFAARLLGWQSRLVDGVSDDAIAALLGLDRDADFFEAEREEPQCLLAVSPAGHEESIRGDAARIAALSAAAVWTGKASQLSEDHVEWRIITEVAAATRTPAHQANRSTPSNFFGSWNPANHDEGVVGSESAVAASIILQRRSCLDLDGHSRVDRRQFLRVMRRAVPVAAPPWDALWWTPRVHLALFVHRVNDLAPGIYVLVRRPDALALLRAELRPDFLWTRVACALEDLPLFCLAQGDCRSLAARLSCDQSIASDGFFSLGMLAELDAAIDAHGPWFYKHLFWEAGVIGQTLYLEAEALGARSTGIGCFYDDPVHQVLGIESHRLQSLYHFTVGMPIDDPRLTSEPGYEWERGESGSLEL
jgi:SagB-type dehydrogenase family enzyme